MLVLIPTYSKLCDSSETLYTEYLQSYNGFVEAVARWGVGSGAVGVAGGLLPGRGSGSGVERCSVESLEIRYDAGTSGRHGGSGVVSGRGLCEDAEVVGRATTAGVGVFGATDGHFGSSGESSAVGSDAAGCIGGAVESDVSARSDAVGSTVGSGGVCAAESVEDAVVDVVVPLGAGKNWLRNRAWKEKKRAQKNNRKLRSASFGVDAALQASLKEKWQAENRLAKLQAERKVRLLQSQDEDALVKMQRAQVLRTTETCKVQVERAFRSLKKTGDVPADGTGTAETVVSGDGTPSLSRSDGSGISPDSSVSMQEIRQMQKDLLDAAEEKKKYEEALGFLEHAVPEQYKQAMYRANCKKAYTLDSQGEPEIDTVGSIRDGKFYPEYLHEGYALNPRHRSARNEVPFPGEEDLW